MTPALLALLVYLTLQFGIGAWVSRRIHTEADYLVAGRRLGYPLLTFSIFATWFGAETVIGSAGIVYREGVSLGSAEPFGYGLCLFLLGFVYAGPLYRRNLTTLADLFRQRFSISVERVAAIILIPSSILWAAAQVRAFGHVLATTTDALDPQLALGLAAGFTILYTAFGGLWADAMTDLVQGVMLSVGLIVVAVAVFANAGGGEALAQASSRVHFAPPHEGGWLDVAEAWAIPVFGSVIATELIGRIVGARSEKVARRSAIMAGALYISIGLLPVMMALIGAPLVPDLADSEQLLPALAQRLLPGVLYAIFAGGLISAILSTVDSTLLVASGLLSHNLIVPLFGVVDEAKKVRIARLGVLSFGLIAYFLALNASGVFELVEAASALGSAGALVAVTFGLFTSWGGPRTAMCTLLAGLLVYLAGAYGGSNYPFLASLLASLVVYLTGSVIELRFSACNARAATRR